MPHPAADQSATPLLDAVITTADRLDDVPLHIPGHKRGSGAHPRLRQAFGRDVFRHDLTELPGQRIIRIITCSKLHITVSGHLPRTCIRARVRQQLSISAGPDIAAGLDYLSSPTGAIAQAQRLAADAFGADHTWFVVNGSTAGIQAAVLAACGPGDTLVAARNCHLSAIAAMVLAGARLRVQGSKP